MFSLTFKADQSVRRTTRPEAWMDFRHPQPHQRGLFTPPHTHRQRRLHAHLECRSTGDARAFGVLYARHLMAARRLATTFVAASAEREDLVAEAFTRMLRALRVGHGPTEEFRPYLLVTLRNTVISRFQRTPDSLLYPSRRPR
jgi:hypothetical protein